uniref:MULE transposase domain-containing protein n=1 Tax=Rhizophagus irregularis (strain DAOM 181602 / DAOM 197198 / MUCL 43194) TaxID=747089 RepID=U9TM85_RHIID
MKRVHEKIRQAGEICYFDASSSFDPLNTSITLLYTSCVAGALPFDLFLTSDESEVTIEFAINKLKSILPSNAFFGRGVDLDPSMFMTDDSAAEHDRSTVISDFKRILYANSENIMNVEYQKFQLQWYNKYSKLARHCSLLWERREFWAVSFRNGASTRGNHTNNYVERSFGIIKDIIFSRVKAYNPIQIYFFIIGNMERFYERKLLAIANKQLNSISKRFFCPRWESVDQNKIVSANIEHMYYVQSTSKSDIFYIVDSNIGICTCPKESPESPLENNNNNASPSENNHANLLENNALRLLDTNSSEIFARSSELELNHQNREYRVKLIKEFLDSVYQDVTNNDQLLLGMESFQKGYEKAKNTSNGQLVSYLHQNYQNLDSRFNVKNRKIPVQVASIQRRKHSKENDPNMMPSRKKRKISKLSHNLSQSIKKNINS